MPLNTEFIDSSDGSELSVDLVSLGAALGASPGGGYQALPFVNPLSVRFDRLYTSYGTHTVVAPVTFTIDSTGAIPGATTTVRLIADGVNTPTFTGFTALESLRYNNTAGAVNIVQFTTLGAVGSLEYYVSFTQPITDLSQPLLFGTRTAAIAASANTYTASGTFAAWSEFMLSTRSLPANTAGAVMMEMSAEVHTPVLGFNTSNVNQGYTNYEYLAWFGGGSLNVGTNGGNLVLAVASKGANKWMRLQRSSTGVVTCALSLDKVTWTTVYTWAGTSTSQMWANANYQLPDTVSMTHLGFV
jgi:hypothetical protein